MKIDSFIEYLYQYGKLILFGHVLNPVWKSRLERRRIRYKYKYLRVEHYLNKYLPFVRNLKASSELEPLSKGEDKIFSIWFQGEENAPQLVKICINRLKQAYGDRYLVLDNKTIRDWVTLPDYIWQKWEKGIITHAHFSDICRVALLYQNGGMWFDATDFLTEKVPEWIEEADLFMFLESDNITPGTIIQSCFMRARKSNPLLGMWLQFLFKYWENEDELVHYFLLHFMLRFMIENNPEFAKLFDNFRHINHDPTHVLWYLYNNEDYSDERYEEWTRDSFFQKTSFKNKNGKDPRPGSVAEKIITGKAPNVKE